MAVGGGGRWWAVEKWTDFRHDTTVPVKQKRFIGLGGQECPRHLELQRFPQQGGALSPRAHVNGMSMKRPCRRNLPDFL
jgi:hypothetical protein